MIYPVCALPHLTVCLIYVLYFRLFHLLIIFTCPSLDSHVHCLIFILYIYSFVECALRHNCKFDTRTCSCNLLRRNSIGQYYIDMIKAFFGPIELKSYPDHILFLRSLIWAERKFFLVQPNSPTIHTITTTSTPHSPWHDKFPKSNIILLSVSVRERIHCEIATGYHV